MIEMLVNIRIYLKMDCRTDRKMKIENWLLDSTFGEGLNYILLYYRPLFIFYTYCLVYKFDRRKCQF